MKKIFVLLFPAEGGQWLALLRLGLGLQIVLYGLLLRSDWNLIFGSQDHGLLGRDVGEAMSVVQSPFIPRLAWITFLLRHLGLGEEAALAAIWWSLLIVGGLVLLGLFSRPVAIAAWFLQLACAKSAGLFAYGADNLTTIGLFYLMIAPLPDPWSLDCYLFHPTAANPRLLGFHRRVLQGHLCLIYFFSGASKCLGADWWNGSNIWRSLTIPPFDRLPTHWIASVGFLLPTLGIAVCLLELAYPFLIWWRPTRKPMLYSICAMHLAIALMMGMFLFGTIMIILNVAAFWPYRKAVEAAVTSPVWNRGQLSPQPAEKIAAEGF